MRKRLFFATVLAVCLAATITAAVFAQAQPSTAPATTNNVVIPGDGANVNLQLPEGSISRPVNLRITVAHVTESDGTIVDVMQVFAWVPARNAYLGIAILSTNINASAIEWVKSIVNGTPIWTPPALMNYFTPTPEQLQITIDNDNVLMANLTASFNVTLPEALGGNFTLPPMTLMFRPIAPGFAHEETMVVPFSGWTVQLSHTEVPAWVRAEIPMWSANAPVETVGTLMLNGTTTYIPPEM